MVAEINPARLRRMAPPQIILRLPDTLLRHKGGLVPRNLSVRRERCDAMKPLVGEGDHLIIEILLRRPATGAMAVPRDGPGLVVKRVEAIRANDPAELRLISVNSVYEPQAVPAQDVHMVGKCRLGAQEGVRRRYRG